jgi:1,2-phenylacetyl-CoA epoxidase PaaB subunit
MPKRTREKLWEVVKISSKGKFLGSVQAPDEKTALKTAIKELNIRPEDQKRVIVRSA